MTHVSAGFPYSAGITMEGLEGRTKELAPRHPFEEMDREQVLRASFEYLAMSEAFPYIQAAAIGRLGEANRSRGVPPDVRGTSVVGMFLGFDEFGAFYKTSKRGAAALPSILDTKDFHAELLKQDLAAYLGKPLQHCPPSAETERYLRRLGHGLGSLDPIDRVATMVSFELHAGRMIGALWGSVAATSEVERDRLEYFRIHVGGDDPGEAYHMAMTVRMIEHLVPPQEAERFIDRFDEAYLLNIDWCAGIKLPGAMAA